MSDLFADPYEVAKTRGLEVVLPGENELFLDIDDEDSRKQFIYIQETLTHNNIEWEVTKETKSVSGNAHIYVKLTLNPPISPLERILLQACLGSDRKRELLGWMRVRMEAKRPPTTFFEVPKGAKDGEFF